VNTLPIFVKLNLAYLTETSGIVNINYPLESR
jgi:hypothetical protein